MIDHIGIRIRDFEASKRFYDAALAPIGWKVVMQFGKGAGYGIDKKPEFFFVQADERSANVHIAFVGEDRATVDAFYEAAMAAGGTDNGKPGIREQYHPHYYGAFVLDPDGNNIEVVCHLPE